MIKVFLQEHQLLPPLKMVSRMWLKNHLYWYKENIHLIRIRRSGITRWSIYKIRNSEHQVLHIIENGSFFNLERVLRGGWSYGSWIYNYLCNQCLSLLQLWVQIPLRRGLIDITLCDKVCQWLVVGQCFLWFPPPIKLIATI